MEWFSQHILGNLPWFWLGVMVVALAVEAVSVSLTTIWFALGAFVAIFVAFFPVPFQWQVVIFCSLSCALLFSTRQVALKKLRLKKTPTNSDALIGKKTRVVERIGELEKGAVKLGGVVWSAATSDGTSIEAGEECVVKSIEGATAVVEKL